MIRTIFLDMDGVIADFMTAALAVHNRPAAILDWPAGVWDIATVLKMNDAAVWRPITAEGHDFWALRIRPYAWADNLLRAIRQAFPVSDLIVASSPSRDPHSASGKLAWLRTHFVTLADSYLLGKRKDLLARPDRLLIDDSDENCEAFVAAGGRAILFPQPWNICWHLTGERFIYLNACLDELSQDSV